jgi:hypothetical protein
VHAESGRGEPLEQVPHTVVAKRIATPEAGNLSRDWCYVIEANRIFAMRAVVFLIAGLPRLLFYGLLVLVQSAVRNRERQRFPAELLAGGSCSR